MPVLKKHLTPLSKAGHVVKHAGKGSKMASASGLGNSNPSAMSMNDYAKMTPMAQPAASPPDTDNDGM